MSPDPRSKTIQAADWVWCLRKPVLWGAILGGAAGIFLSMGSREAVTTEPEHHYVTTISLDQALQGYINGDSAESIVESLPFNMKLIKISPLPAEAVIQSDGSGETVRYDSLWRFHLTSPEKIDKDPFIVSLQRTFRDFVIAARKHKEDNLRASQADKAPPPSEDTGPFRCPGKTLREDCLDQVAQTLDGIPRRVVKAGPDMAYVRLLQGISQIEQELQTSQPAQSQWIINVQKFSNDFHQISVKQRWQNMHHVFPSRTVARVAKLQMAIAEEEALGYWTKREAQERLNKLKTLQFQYFALLSHKTMGKRHKRAPVAKKTIITKTSPLPPEEEAASPTPEIKQHLTSIRYRFIGGAIAGGTATRIGFGLLFGTLIGIVLGGSRLIYLRFQDRFDAPPYGQPKFSAHPGGS